MLDKFNELIQLISGKGTRSTVLIDLRWSLGFLTVALVVAASMKVGLWICIGLFVLVVLAQAAHLGAWIYFVKKNDVNALRTEQFILRQQEIEKLGSKATPQFIDVPSKRIDAPSDAPSTNHIAPINPAPDKPEAD